MTLFPGAGNSPKAVSTSEILVGNSPPAQCHARPPPCAAKRRRDVCILESLCIQEGTPSGLGVPSRGVPPWSGKGWLGKGSVSCGKGSVSCPSPRKRGIAMWSGLRWVGSPCPPRSPARLPRRSPAPSLACPIAHLPHRQSSLSLTEGKLEGEGRLQSAWRAQRLSHQMTTGDSEPARICIHFASHLHRICSLPSPHPSIILLRGWGGGGGLSPGPLNGE